MPSLRSFTISDRPIPILRSSSKGRTLDKSSSRARSLRRVGNTVAGNRLVKSSRPVVVEPDDQQAGLSAHARTTCRVARRRRDRSSHAQWGHRRTASAGGCSNAIPVDLGNSHFATDARASAAPRCWEDRCRAISVVRTRRLERLNPCASDDCRWIFFDRSKPANRRWCSSSRCGNRAKVMRYRAKGEQSAPD